MRRFLLLIVVLLYTSGIHAQIHDLYAEDHTPYIAKRGRIVAGTQGALIAGTLIGLNELWYKQYPRSSFHFFNDNLEWMQMDKTGHVLSAYSIGYVSSEMWQWTGIYQRKCILIGGLTGFGYLTAIEMMDGFSTGWGFSYGDMIANAAGTLLLIGQEYLWREQRVQPKFGFRQSGYAQYRPELLGDGYLEEFLKDYNGQTYWLSINVRSYIHQLESKWPDWLNVAVGYGANGMTGGHENPVMFNSQGNQITLDRYRQYYISIDIDFRYIYTRSKFLNSILRCLSFIKVPLPGIELSKHGVRPLLFAF